MPAINAPARRVRPAANGYDSAVKKGISAAADVHDVNVDIARLRTAFQADADALAGADLLDLVGEVGQPVNRLAVGLDNDVAVLRIKNARQLPPPVALGSSTELKVGQSAFAIGNPFGLDQSLTSGIISALKRRLPT